MNTNHCSDQSLKYEIIKVKHVTPIQWKIEKFCLQVIADACVKIAVLEIYSEKKTRESVVGTFKNISTVAVHCWYIKDTFSEFYQQIFGQNISEGILGKIRKTLLSS